jgi:pyruvate,orthophosphate dikinase
MPGLMREKLREEMQIEFTIENGKLHVLDGVRVPRSARAAVRIAVALAEDGIIPREEAVMRVEPRALNELLHRQVDPDARATCWRAASPPAPARHRADRLHRQRGAGQRRAGEPCILVRRETSPRTSAACMPPWAC